MMLDLRKFLFRFVVLVVRIWLVKALFLRILPLPVRLNLLAAPLFDFIFGIVNSRYLAPLLRCWFLPMFFPALPGFQGHPFFLQLYLLPAWGFLKDSPFSS